MISDIINYAVKIEGQMFERASNAEEYYHYAAENIYKLTKNLEIRNQQNEEKEKAREQGGNMGVASQDQLQSTGQVTLMPRLSPVMNPQRPQVTTTNQHQVSQARMTQAPIQSQPQSTLSSLVNGPSSMPTQQQVPQQSVNSMSYGSPQSNNSKMPHVMTSPSSNNSQQQPRHQVAQQNNIVPPPLSPMLNSTFRGTPTSFGPQTNHNSSTSTQNSRMQNIPQKPSTPQPGTPKSQQQYYQPSSGGPTQSNPHMTMKQPMPQPVLQQQLQSGQQLPNRLGSSTTLISSQSGSVKNSQLPSSTPPPITLQNMLQQPQPATPQPLNSITPTPPPRPASLPTANQPNQQQAISGQMPQSQSNQHPHIAQTSTLIKTEPNSVQQMPISQTPRNQIGEPPKKVFKKDPYEEPKTSASVNAEGRSPANPKSTLAAKDQNIPPTNNTLEIANMAAGTVKIKVESGLKSEAAFNDDNPKTNIESKKEEDSSSSGGKGEVVSNSNQTNNNNSTPESKQGSVKSNSSISTPKFNQKDPDLKNAVSGPVTPISSQYGSNKPIRPAQKKTFKPDELRQALMPVLEKLNIYNPESLPFRQPVDPVVLQIPDYYQIVKKPMDLSTIKRKLDTGMYSDPWQYVDDVWLMFENAWLYNKKNSKVYKFSTKLSEIFEGLIDPVMVSLGYCCGRKNVFQPQILLCFGKELCQIPRDAKYMNYQDRYVTLPI